MKKLITVFSALLIVSVAFISISCDEIISPELADKKVTVTFDVPDTVNIRIFKNYKQLHELTGNQKSVVLRPGSYGLEFYTNYFLYAENLHVIEDSNLNFHSSYDSAKTAVINFEVPDSVSVRISYNLSSVHEFRGNLYLRLKKGLYNIVFAGNYFQFNINLNIDQSAIINYLEYFINLIRGFVFVRGGTFQMGSNNGDDDEKPIHSVTLSDFMIGKYEVTQGLWKSVMGNNPSRFTGDDNLPVERVSWYDAVEFCNKLSEKEGLQKVYSGSGKSITMNMNANGYRLPTEAEWEYAAKGGSLSKGYEYSGSSNAGDVAWYMDNSNDKTHPVGQKQPNELGIYDMSGNVSEWCWDWKGDYSSDSQTNPAGPTSGSGRVCRGGGWVYYAGSLRLAGRGSNSPDSRNFDWGFRLVRSK